MRVAIWLHHTDMEACFGRRLSQSLCTSDHTEGPLMKYFLVPGTSTINFEDVVLRILVENRADLEEYIELTQHSLKEAEQDRAYLESKLESTSLTKWRPTHRRSGLSKGRWTGGEAR